MHRLFSWLLLHTYYKVARLVELQLNMEWYKLEVLGSNWTLLPKNSPPSPPPPPLPPNLHAFNNILLCVGTDLSHCISPKAVVKVSYETMCNQLFLYILHIKYSTSKLLGSLESIFWVDPKNLSTHKCVPTSSQGVSFSLVSFQSGSKNLNERQYLGVGALFSHPTQSSNECT